MTHLTVRNIPDEIYRALCARAAQHSRSAEAELLDILSSAGKPKPGARLRMGDALSALGRKIGMI